MDFNISQDYVTTDEKKEQNIRSYRETSSQLNLFLVFYFRFVSMVQYTLSIYVYNYFIIFFVITR